MKKLSILISTVIITSAGLVGCETNSNENTQSKALLTKIKNEGNAQPKKTI
jgi:L-cystine transport system substrate-binding protein